MPAYVPTVWRYASDPVNPLATIAQTSRGGGWIALASQCFVPVFFGFGTTGCLGCGLAADLADLGDDLGIGQDGAISCRGQGRTHCQCAGRLGHVLPRHHHGGSQPHPGKKAGNNLPRLRPFAVPDIVFKINSDFVDLPAAADAATQFLEGNNASEGVIFAANLAIEEIVTNTIKYGYDDARKHEIIVRLEVTENSLNIEICDDGREFNPFNEPEPNVSLRSDEPRIGGLGVHFVRKMLDTCAYDRRKGRNIVKLSKKL